MTFDEILTELSHRLNAPKPSRFSVSTALKHPAAIVVLTFLFTTLVGGFLSSSWRRSEWEHEQRRQNVRREIDLKYKIVDDLTTAVAETTTGAEEVLLLAYWDVPNKKEETAERRKYWQTSSRAWRVASKRLQVALATHFSQAVANSFDRLLTERREWGNDITNLLNETATIKAGSSDTVLPKVRESITHLAELTKQMTGEIREDESRAERAKSSDTLFGMF